MRRRAFITLLGGAVAWPLAARAQQGERVRRIGVLSLRRRTSRKRRLTTDQMAFVAGRHVALA
jgi:putative ABC transport system substrate-binding protein